MPQSHEGQLQIYTLVITSADTDNGNFPDPDTIGSYSSLRRAQTEMEHWIHSQEGMVDSRFDRTERDDNHWEAYQDGYGAACFVRIDIVESTLVLTS